MSEASFVPGLFAKAPRDNAPDFVKGSVSIKVEEVGKFLREVYAKGEEWLNLDLKESRDGKYYLQINDWKPAQDSHSAAKSNGYQPQAEDIPF